MGEERQGTSFAIKERLLFQNNYKDILLNGITQCYAILELTELKKV